MEIIIDGEPRELALGEIATFGELMEFIQNEVVIFPNVVTRVILNEEELDEGQEIGFGKFSISEILSLALETDNTTTLAYDSLFDAQDYLPELSGILENAAKLIREGKIQAGLLNASQALEVVSAFGQVLDSIRGAFQIDFSKIRIDEIILLDKLNQLNQYANDVLKATQDENWTLFADLIEYELSPLLYEWMAVIPELVKLLPTPPEIEKGEGEG
jgi:hypothetical protein